jgi:hypothetical protein
MNKAVLLALLFSGCAIPGAPVGWGGTHRVIAANEKSVTIEYDSVVGGYEHAVAEANRICGQSGKSAVPTANHHEGVLRVQVFECR